MLEATFKICTTCFKEWNSATEFLEDPAIVIIGYQVNFKKLESGIFLFNHEKCKSTIALCVDAFSHLRNGPIFTENKAGKDGCPEYCFELNKLSPCKNTCECRWVRDVMQVIKDWDKTI